MFHVCHALLFDTQLPEDLTVYSDSLPKLVEIGMKIPLSWAQEKLAIPLASEDEPVLAFQTDVKTDLKNASLSYRRVALSKLARLSARRRRIWIMRT